MAVAVTSLVKDIISDIPEIPVFIAVRQYLRAMRQLCEHSRVWRVDGTLTTTADNPLLSTVSILPELTELLDVISLKPVSGEAAVKARTSTWLDNNESDWRSQSALTAKYYYRASNDVLRLVYTPSDTVSYYARLAVKPTLDCEDVSEIVANKYDELLIHGAKGFLFATPRKPWTDLKMAQYHEMMFQAGLPDARADAADEFQTGVARKVKYGGY